jgi:preprotein translocase subunit YajC
MFPVSFLTEAGAGGGGMMSIILMVVLFIGVFYFFGIRPQKKQEKQAAEMRNSLMVGDEITTIGGIIGKIVSLKEETMVIETTRDHTRIRLLKSAVRSVDVRVEETRAPKAETEPAQEAPAEQENN